MIVIGVGETKTLCIGLDLAWYGGSKNDRWSQYDVVSAAAINAADDVVPFWRRVSLRRKDNRECERDVCARQTLTAIKEIVSAYGSEDTRIVLAVDAPLAESGEMPRNGRKRRRACEQILSTHRMAIDKAAGGARGWHPTIQPGAPIPPRVSKLVAGLRDLGFALWNEQTASAGRLLLEVFPSEAIWATHHLVGYGDLTATQVREYKKQKRNRLNEEAVREFIKTVLRPMGAATRNSFRFERIVSGITADILKDGSWRFDDGTYRGGKPLDDAVDSLICLAVAISYAGGNAHVWTSEASPEDGHIIGPGVGDHCPWRRAE